jgi:hypothetical protein
MFAERPDGWRLLAAAAGGGENAQVMTRAGP